MVNLIPAKGRMRGLVHQWITTISATLSVATSSAGYTWIAPLLTKLVSDDSPVPMTTTDTSWLSSLIEIGTVMSSMPVSVLADRYGRKKVILYTGTINLLCYVLIGTTKSLVVLYFVRIFQGIAVATTYTVVPLYLAEISEPGVRGTLGNQIEVLWAAGKLFSYTVGPYLSYNNYAYISAILPVAFLITYPLVPESPYYLLMIKEEEKADKALAWLRGEQNDYKTELQNIKEYVDKEVNSNKKLKDVFFIKKNRHIFLIIQIIWIVTMLSGGPVIFIYATPIISEIFRTTLNSDLMSIMFNSILLLASLSVSFIFDRFGRRTLLIAAIAGSGIAALVMSIIFFLEKQNIDVSSVRWLGFISFIIFSVLCSSSLQSLAAVIQGECFPSYNSGILIGLCSVTGATAAFISVRQYQIVNDYFGIHMNFFVFFLIMLIGTIVFIKIIPETSGLSLVQIQTSFESEEKPNSIQCPTKSVTN